MGAWINRQMVILLFLVVLFGATEAFWARGSRAVEGNLPQPVSKMEIMKGQLYFFFENELWKSDGTAAGTRMVKDLGAAALLFPGISHR